MGCEAATRDLQSDGEVVPSLRVDERDLGGLLRLVLRLLLLRLFRARSPPAPARPSGVPRPAPASPPPPRSCPTASARRQSAPVRPHGHRGRAEREGRGGRLAAPGAPEAWARRRRRRRRRRARRPAGGGGGGAPAMAEAAPSASNGWRWRRRAGGRRERRRREAPGGGGGGGGAPAPGGGGVAAARRRREEAAAVARRQPEALVAAAARRRARPTTAAAATAAAAAAAAASGRCAVDDGRAARHPDPVAGRRGGRRRGRRRHSHRRRRRHRHRHRPHRQTSLQTRPTRSCRRRRRRCGGDVPSETPAAARDARRVSQRMPMMRSSARPPRRLDLVFATPCRRRAGHARTARAQQVEQRGQVDAARASSASRSALDGRAPWDAAIARVASCRAIELVPPLCAAACLKGRPGSPRPRCVAAAALRHEGTRRSATIARLPDAQRDWGGRATRTIAKRTRGRARGAVPPRGLLGHAVALANN